MVERCHGNEERNGEGGPHTDNQLSSSDASQPSSDTVARRRISRKGHVPLCLSVKRAPLWMDFCCLLTSARSGSRRSICNEMSAQRCCLHLSRETYTWFLKFGGVSNTDLVELKDSKAANMYICRDGRVGKVRGGARNMYREGKVGALRHQKQTQAQSQKVQFRLGSDLLFSIHNPCR